MKKNAEKNKKLSEAEKRRLEKFEKLSDELQQQGYIRHVGNTVVVVPFGSAISVILSYSHLIRSNARPLRSA